MYPRRREADDYSEWSTVVAIDPGGTTGWSVLAVHPESLSDPDTMILANVEHWAQGQVSGNEFAQAREVIELLDCWPHAAVLVEDFILRRMDRSRDLLSPVRLTAIIEFTMYEQNRRVFRQQPSEAKNTATDDRLRSWKLYRREGGEEHARDATRHAITFLRRAKERVKLRAMAWPDKYDPKTGELTWPAFTED